MKIEKLRILLDEQTQRLKLAQTADNNELILSTCDQVNFMLFCILSLAQGGTTSYQLLMTA